MTAILNVLLEVTIYSAILYGAILLFKKIFYKHISAALNYAVWALLIIRLLMPVTIDSGFSLFVIPESAMPMVQSVDTANMPSAAQISDTAAMSKTASQGTASYEVGNTNTNAAGQSASKPSVKIKINWQTALVLLWATGILGSAGYTAALGRRLNRQIRRSREIPSYVLELIEECKQDLGIKNELQVTMHDWLNSPALSAALRPRLLLPSGMLKMSRRQIEFGIRHELTHYKRKDHLMTLLLLVLRCVYWFNPIIWLSFPQIQTDMETLCDVRVTSFLKKTERVSYINTMVELSGRPNVRYVLGMGICKGRKALENRVKGIFMKRKTKNPVRMAAVLIAGIMMITCFTTACQPTPEASPVVGRQNDILPSSVPSEDFQQIETPAHITETDDQFPHIKMTYDADVIVPETTAYPVTEVKRKNFSDDDMLSIIKLMAGKNDELYAKWDLTKDECLQLLTEAKKSGIVTESSLDALQKNYDEAPAEVENPRVSLSDLPTDRPSEVFVKTGESKVSRFSFKRNDNSEFVYYRNPNMSIYPAGSLVDSQFDAKMGDTPEQWAWLKPGEPEISQQDAYKKALEYKNALGIDLDLYKAEPCSVVTDYVHKTTGWQFTFTRKVSNLQAQVEMDGFYTNPSALPSYGSPWGEEVFRITVDKDGPCSLDWRGTSEISRTAVESAEMEPFDTIHQRITNQLSYVYAWSESIVKDQDLEIKVTKIELGISMISVQDRTDIGEYLPTWYVSFQYKYEDDAQDAWMPQRIMFSAIDGSYIEPRVTNTDLMENKNLNSGIVKGS